MSGRILMATVAVLALTIPAIAQDATAPADAEQSATPETEQTEPQEGAAEGAGEQAPAMTEEALYTTSRPTDTITITVRNRIQSVFRRDIAKPPQFV